MRRVNLHDRASDLEDISREIEINLMGPIRMVKQFLPHLKSKKAAAIVNVTSGLAFVPLPISPVYCAAAKAGLHSFTLSLQASSLKKTAVQVFELVAPGDPDAAARRFQCQGYGRRRAHGRGGDGPARDQRLGKDESWKSVPDKPIWKLKLMNRIAPQFILNQLGKSVGRHAGRVLRPRRRHPDVRISFQQRV